MAKYYIKSYTKEKQSFMSRINSICETTGDTLEPFKIKLKRVTWWGSISEVTRDVSLPGSFNYVKQLTKGREWIN